MNQPALPDAPEPCLEPRSPKPQIYEDHRFVGSKVEGRSFDFATFRTASGNDLVFEKVSFKYCRFDDCYFRACTFKRCDFTGCRFTNCNLRSSEFPGSDFKYARFGNTLVTDSLLDQNLPGYENQAMLLARVLRSNFGQVGDAEAVNKAIAVELEATKTHYYKAAWSRETYYRDKHKDWDRVRVVWRHAMFWLLDFAWGNGESIRKLGRTILIVNALIFLAMLTVVDAPTAATGAIPVFFGVPVTGVPPWVAATAAFFRYLLLGAFTAIAVKRLSRR